VATPNRIADPSRSDKLFREFGMSKAEAFRLWGSGESAGQMYAGVLVLSRADVLRVIHQQPEDE
jgi:hypothetical protein